MPRKSDKTYQVILPERAADKLQVIGLTVIGASLETLAIYDGDTIICRKSFPKTCLKTPTLCVVEYHKTKQTVARYVQRKGKDVLITHPDESKSELTPCENVTVTAVIIGFQRNFPMSGLINKPRGSNEWADILDADILDFGTEENDA